MRDDVKLSRGRRFAVYFLRWFGLLTISSVFFQGLNSNSYSPIQMGIISITSFLFVTPITALLYWLMKAKLEFTIKNKNKVKEANVYSGRFYVGLFISLCYLGGCIFVILLVAVNSSESLNDALLITFFIQIVQDILVN